ncbi:MAG: ATP-binding protein [Methanosarcinales archaeon]|nr:ATP-binding protein [Methanosarcinales archaeon]
MLNMDELSGMNSWWKLGSVRAELVPQYKRDLFSEIREYLELRQILAIVGLRRTGKTTIMLQTVDQLIKEGVAPKRILYFSFDEDVEDLKEVIDFYRENILKEEIAARKIYIFLDEIQKLEDWQNKIKIYYDQYPQIKFFVSGSASLNILLNAKESLAGRIFYFDLDVLSFEEFLELRGKDVGKIKSDIDLYKHEIKCELNDYFLKPFPEIINLNDDIAKRYIKESIIEKAVFRDLSTLFKIKDVELIDKLIRIIASNPGLMINLDEIAKEMGRSRQTISNYLYYMETCFILKNVRNFRGSFKASSRKLKKYYLIHPCVALALANPASGKLVENLIQFMTKAEHFWRDGGKEVDFILFEDESTIPIESKYSSTVRSRDVKGMLKFMREHAVKTGFVITEDYEATGNYEGRIIKFIPLWKWVFGGGKCDGR